MSTNIVASFAHKSESATWLSSNWLAWSERQLALKAQFAELSQMRTTLRDFEIRCARALALSHNASHSNPVTTKPESLSATQLRKIVARVTEGRKLTFNYPEACATYTMDHMAAWRSYEKQRRQLRKLQALTKRYYKRFGHDQEFSYLAEYLDDERDTDRWSWLDSFSHEREMPGHNQFVCPVCAMVSTFKEPGPGGRWVKWNTVQRISDESVIETGYVNPCCRNFECSRYGEPLMSLTTFQAWLDHGSPSSVNFNQERREYDFERQLQRDLKEMQDAEREKMADRGELSPRGQDVIYRALKVCKLHKRALPGTHRIFYHAPTWRMIGPVLPKQGNIGPEIGEYVESTYSYLNHTRVKRVGRCSFVGRRSMDVHRTVGRWEPEIPEMWDYTANPHAIGVRSSGSMVVARH